MPAHIPGLSPEPPLPRWLVALRVPTALRTSPGMLFPASSSLHRALLRGREFTRARPPRRPMLFQRRSGRKPAVTRRSAPGQSRARPGLLSLGEGPPCRSSAHREPPHDPFLPLCFQRTKAAARESGSRKAEGAEAWAPDRRPGRKGQCRVASPSCWRLALQVRAKASSSAPLWLIWLLRRSSCLRVPLPARALEKAAKASSHVPRLFHSRVRLQERWP